MTLQAEVKRGLAGMPLFASGEHALEAAHDRVRLRCDLVALDGLACAFTRLAVHNDSRANMSTDEVRQVAEHLAGNADPFEFGDFVRPDHARLNQ